MGSTTGAVISIATQCQVGDGVSASELSASTAGCRAGPSAVPTVTIRPPRDPAIHSDLQAALAGERSKYSRHALMRPCDFEDRANGQGHRSAVERDAPWL